MPCRAMRYKVRYRPPYLLDLPQLVQSFLDFGVHLLEAFGIQGQFFLDLLGVNEEWLQVTPRLLKGMNSGQADKHNPPAC